MRWFSKVVSSSYGVTIWNKFIIAKLWPVQFFLQLRDAFNRFPDFFVRAFKIVVDSWKFSILLLHIL